MKYCVSTQKNEGTHYIQIHGNYKKASWRTVLYHVILYVQKKKKLPCVYI